jgi:hypothetical protein
MNKIEISFTKRYGKSEHITNRLEESCGNYMSMLFMENLEVTLLDRLLVLTDILCIKGVFND